MHSPMPLAPPVISATFPSSLRARNKLGQPVSTQNKVKSCRLATEEIKQQLDDRIDMAGNGRQQQLVVFLLPFKGRNNLIGADCHGSSLCSPSLYGESVMSAFSLPRTCRGWNLERLRLSYTAAAPVQMTNSSGIYKNKFGGHL